MLSALDMGNKITTEIVAQITMPSRERWDAADLDGAPLLLSLPMRPAL